jgi:hypothetical protein
MKRTTPFLLVLVLFGWVASSSALQFTDAGKLDSWTTRLVARQYSAQETPYVRSVRVARHDGYDRVVFEFTGAMPNYNIEYLKSHFYEDEGGRHRIRIAGTAFIQVSLTQIPANEEQLKFSESKNFVPKGRLKSPSVLQIEEAGLWEGNYDFLLGIRGRKPFRVSELNEPRRLVIDFKH